MRRRPLVGGTEEGSSFARSPRIGATRERSTGFGNATKPRSDRASSSTAFCIARPMQALELASASDLPRSCVVPGAPVRIKLRTPMLLRFRCNFVRLKDDLQLLNVPQTCASHGPSYRAHPRLYLRCRAGAWRMSGLLRVQPLGDVNYACNQMRFLAERTQFRRDRVVVAIARKHLLPDPLFFRCIFSGRSRRSERHVATRIPLGLVPLEANQIISKDGIVTSGRRLRRCPVQQHDECRWREGGPFLI